MSSINDYMTNIPNKTTSASSTQKLTTETTGKSTLDIDDFFQLMAAQLQNQDMTNPMDQSEFMNQLTMMSAMQAIEDITSVSLISYAASLVGKDVTIGKTDSDGNISELYGTVTATGMYAGEQVVFVEGNSYKLSQIMAVGKLPETDTSGTENGGQTNENN
ncbi:flagellar hook assembly protein FlgD [Anaerotignum sp.]|uniref:flagellar hook assembly protein FlgD n=1 Tax=Anaerotignum sp. TaxID=2039241 RepID=UPI0027149FD1|nr:flagellar hook capping FlgD N-terminal domain-containing protein [Anaerotignum sp.]